MCSAVSPTSIRDSKEFGSQTHDTRAAGEWPQFYAARFSMAPVDPIWELVRKKKWRPG